MVTLPDSTDSEIGFLLLKSVVRPASWIPRRVERIELLDDVSARRRMRLDVDLSGLLASTEAGRGESEEAGREYAEVLPLWRGKVLVALAVVDRACYASFDVLQADGSAFPRLTRFEERGFVLAGVKSLAERVLGGHLSPDVSSRLQQIIHDNTGMSEAELQAVLRDGGQGCRLAGHDKFMSILSLVATNYLLVVGLEPTSRRQVVTYEQQAESFVDLHIPARKRFKKVVRAFHFRKSSLGVSERRINCPAASNSESYHVEVLAPDGLCINGGGQLSACGERPLRFSGRHVSQNLVHAYVSNEGDTLINSCSYTVAFRHSPTGIVRSAPCSAALTVLVMLLGFDVVMLTDSHAVRTDLQTTTALLLLFPAILGTILAHPTNHTLTAQTIFPTRMLLSVVSLVPWVASFALLAKWEGALMVWASSLALAASVVLTLPLVGQYITLRRLAQEAWNAQSSPVRAVQRSPELYPNGAYADRLAHALRHPPRIADSAEAVAVIRSG